jgi:hypothetical protein
MMTQVPSLNELRSELENSPFFEFKLRHSGTVYARANVFKQSGRILMGEGEITDTDGNLLVKGSGTWKSMGKR